MKTYSFGAEVQQEEDGRWSSWIDALLGCAAWGYTRKEALDALKDAAEIYVEDLLGADEDLLVKGNEVIEAPFITVTV